MSFAGRNPVSQAHGQADGYEALALQAAAEKWLVLVAHTQARMRSSRAMYAQGRALLRDTRAAPWFQHAHPYRHAPAASDGYYSVWIPLPVVEESQPVLLPTTVPLPSPYPLE
jgi:hypothetical protein